MPRKVRELIADLERAGFKIKGGKGSHRRFQHPQTKTRAIVSGNLGADALPYQEQQVMEAIKDSKL